MKTTHVVFLAVVLFGMTIGQSWAHSNDTGYSGAPGSSGTCAGSCHGSSGGTAMISGFPQSYTPNQQYLITIQKLSGSSIRNFNASCRIGTGSQNAGTLSAGTNTSTYNTSGETNGVHLTSSNRDSATFFWMAPPAGTGAVRLYVASLQGNVSGQNTVITATAAEAVAMPGASSNPIPVDGASDVAWNAALSWTAGDAATSRDVYFGLENPPSFVENQTAISYDPEGVLLPDTVYYWRIDERNDEGVTEGTVWSFRTAVVSAIHDYIGAVPREMILGPVYPNPFNATLTISFALPQAQEISLIAYDILGRQAAVLALGRYAEGTHRLQWNSPNIGTGIYFLKLQSAWQTLTTKVVALK